MARVSASFSGLMSHRERRTYEHRIKAQIIATGDPTLSRTWNTTLDGSELDSPWCQHSSDVR